MNKKVVKDFFDYAIKKHSPKFVGEPTNTETFDFNFKQRELPRFEKSNLVTINPIKL